VIGAVDPHIADGGFPASHPGVVAVTDDPSSNLAGVFIAPGRDTPTAEPGGKFAFVSGSSYAAAHVSGLFALLKEHNGPGATALNLVTLRRGGGPIDTCASVLRSACPRPPGAYPTVARE
jgi:subtilisin family serine protease